MIMILLIVLIIICFVCIILIAKGIKAQYEEEGRQHRRELYKIWTGHFSEEENTKPKDSKHNDQSTMKRQKHESWIEMCARNAKFDIIGYVAERYRQALNRKNQ